MGKYEQEVRVQESVLASSPGLQAELERLPPDMRSLLEKKYFKGYSVKEIAEEQGDSPKRVAHALTAARDTLRKLLKRDHLGAEER